MKDTLFYHIVRLVRPRQWLKNVVLFAALFFAGKIFDLGELFRATEGFIIFIVIASGVYVLNDIFDAPRDFLHPIKNNRPIPSGKVSLSLAWILSTTFLFVGLALAFRVNLFFFLAVLTYVIMQVFYTMYLKNVIILDALIVAFGFVLRVFAGAFVVGITISSWLVLATVGLALLLAFGKRRSERTLIIATIGESNIKTRPILNRYPESLLDSMISTSASFTIVTYSLFVFLVSPVKTTSKLISELLPQTLASPKWMMLTIPIVIYGVARYLYVIYEKKEGESPERVLLGDKPMLATVILWGFVTFVIYYIIT